MMAPVDIGLDHVDASLQEGQADLFALESEEFATVSNETPGLTDTEQEDIEDSDDSDDGHSQTNMLDQLDTLYLEYKRRRAEKDSSFKASENRKRNKLRDNAWNGIELEESDDSENDQVGGWEHVWKVKDKADEDGDDDDDEDLVTSSSSESGWLLSYTR